MTWRFQMLLNVNWSALFYRCIKFPDIHLRQRSVIHAKSQTLRHRQRRHPLGEQSPVTLPINSDISESFFFSALYQLKSIIQCLPPSRPIFLSALQPLSVRIFTVNILDNYKAFKWLLSNCAV